MKPVRNYKEQIKLATEAIKDWPQWKKDCIDKAFNFKEKEERD